MISSRISTMHFKLCIDKMSIDAPWPDSTNENHIFRSFDVTIYLKTQHGRVKDGDLLGIADFRFLLTL